VAENLVVARVPLFLFTTLLTGASPEVAVIVHTGEVFSPQAWQAMQEESGRIALQAGIRVKFVDHAQASGREFQDLVVFRVTGKCEMDSFPALLDERGPYAWAITHDENVTSFGQVRCDRIRESVKTAMHGGDYSWGNALLGRALGRIVAHELYHMLANTKTHGKTGVARDALTARQLIADSLDLSDHDRPAMRGRRDFRRQK
jgi:hypothetical protein